ncbi:hypothetical protein BKA61DRAFT_204427 [Leptodontidium sp. MPI-SDFR-AT-0119]|nr:hypothetical protein BKA61DRAFT_204427 [Leptodontidium sp. MPI-SDFR-AT-0119]
MIPIEMIQTTLAQPTAPPSSPNLPSSERTVILSSDLQLIDMVKSVVVMQITSHLEQLILKLNEAKLPIVSESHESVDGEEEDDQYRFLVRHQIDEQSKDRIIHVEIKSECLRDLLRTVLGDVCGISLDEGKLSIEQSVFQTLQKKHGIRFSLMDFHPVDGTSPEHRGVPEPYINLNTLEAFEGS